MHTIYILLGGFECESTHVLAVFDDKDLAYKELEVANKQEECYGYDYCYLEKKVLNERPEIKFLANGSGQLC